MNFRNWLPTTQQMSDALQLRREAYLESSMQQALGMILIIGWLAGLIPFTAVEWIGAARIGTAVPLAELAHSGVEELLPTGAFAPLAGATAILSDTFAQLAGMDQPVPGWMAAGLSALGGWISMPFGWLQFWLIYGLLVVVACRVFGATMTLQRFFGATGFFAVPLLLIGLTVIPYAGWFLRLVAVLWAGLIYLRSVEAVTGLDRTRAIISILLPLIGLIILLMLAAGLAGFALSLLMFR